ncbi:MAG TPA: cellulose synthase subunit BcsC-related outer membrane protein [Terracidiphilus sp.]|nr:cellulose synthase subunit BcsC-related outer membrane protein [Terracidiphilus sp.]
MRYFHHHLSILLVLFLGAASALPQSQGGVDILLSNARSLEARGRIDLAAQNWHKVLLVNPNQAEALAGLARSAKENGRGDEERSYLDRLRKLNPHDPQIAAVEKLRVFTPEERSRLDEAGRLAMQHKPDQAMAIYREVLGEQQPPLGKWAQPFYETEAASSGGREKAISQLRQLCAENPRQEVYRLWLASLLTWDPKTRLEGFRLLESIHDPAFAEQARAPWRQALLWEKNNPEALDPLQAYLQRYHDPDLQPMADALAAKQQQHLADAEKAQGFNALRGQHLEVAAARFSEVLRQSPNDANATIGLGYVRLDQKRFSEALSLFDRARTLAPDRQDARDGYDSAKFWMTIDRAAAYLESKQSVAAALGYQDALTLRPSDIGALLGLANAFVQERQFAQAEARFQQVLTLAPNNGDAMAGLGFVRLNEGKFDDAQRLFAEARRLNPARADIGQGYRKAEFWGTMNKGALALNQNRPKDAVAAYQQAVLLNPSDKDALHGLANACVRAEDYPEAVKTYEKLIAAYPNDDSNWLGLIQAQVSENAPQAAIASAQRIPPAVKLRMETRSDFLSEMALVYYKANQAAAADQALSRALQVARTADTEDALSLRLQMAGAFMDRGQTLRAIEIYRNATQFHPNNANGWIGLVGAYTRMRNFPQAVAAVRSMPQRTYDKAAKNTGFLNSAALLYATEGRCAEAQYLLQRSLSLDQTAGHLPSESTQMQLADIWTREHNYTKAQDLYFDIVARDRNSADAWRGYLAVLHQEHADRTLAAELARIPSAARAQLETDASFLILEASAYSSAGRMQDALPLLMQARSRYTAQHKVAPIDLELQTAWTMLAVSPDEPALGDLLTNARSRKEAISQQREAIEEIWSIWSVQRAEKAFDTKPQLAISILTDAARQYPSDRNIHAALATLYLKRHDNDGALDVFRTWGMANAQAGDYRLAAGAALSSHKSELAEQFVHRGLSRFPNDPELMHMAARQDIARGDYAQGEQELRSALVALHTQNASWSETKTMQMPKLKDSAADATGVQTELNSDSVPSQSAPACRAEPAGNVVSDGRIRPISLTFIVHRRSFNAQTAPGQTEPSQTAPIQNPATQDPAQKQKEEQQMQDEVEVVQNRNTPLITAGGLGTGRIGDPGIDELVVGDTLLGTAYTVSNQVRLAIDAHGVYAYSGTPDGTSKLKFGTLPAHASFAQQDQIGYWGLAELSTNTFGIAAGTSPQGFPVHNLIGGIRYRPLGGWLTFEGIRDTVRDSLLSYAGARDPGTGIRWGGVVSNTGSVRFDSAPSNGSVYKRFGEYGSGSYSLLQGRHVPDNWSIAANAGFYWQVVQGLTVGVNANAMHYDRNLKYFSFGQGGYFSPQQYYLGSVPISWYSRHPRFEYAIKFSGGLQYLHENATPYYPVRPGSAIVTPGTYASDNSATPNYDAEVRLGYRVTPHLYFDTFATANNARDYFSQSLGFNLRFMINPIPTRTDLRVNSIPDWTGKQPFSIQ